MKYKIWEETLTESVNFTGGSTLLGEEEASDHRAAYQAFLLKHPHMKGSPLVVKNGMIGIEFGA